MVLIVVGGTIIGLVVVECLEKLFDYLIDVMGTKND